MVLDFFRSKLKLVGTLHQQKVRETSAIKSLWYTIEILSKLPIKIVVLQMLLLINLCTAKAKVKFEKMKKV